jgi:hypothetical protein
MLVKALPLFTIAFWLLAGVALDHRSQIRWAAAISRADNENVVRAHGAFVWADVGSAGSEREVRNRCLDGHRVAHHGGNTGLFSAENNQKDF